MNFLYRFLEYISDYHLFNRSNKLVLAVSGGLDSVVLCHLCKNAGYDFSIAHCNFGLRGAESDRDEAFVKGLATQYGIPFYVNHFDTKTFATENKLSIQVAARELRYKWFHELVNSQESIVNVGNKQKVTFHDSQLTTQNSRLSYIITAHHADDNIETLLMNFFKGTGISGLHGILPKAGKVVRPLLFATREEIQAYAHVHQLQWVEDSSNAETKYTRNYFRQELIPSIQKVFPAVKENLIDTIQRFREVEMIYKEALVAKKKKLLEYKGAEVHIPVLKLQRSLPVNTIVYEISKEYNFSSQQVPEIIKLLSSESGKYISSSTHRILRNRGWLIIAPIISAEQSIIVINEGISELAFTGGKLQLEEMPVEQTSLNIEATIALLDKRYIQFPLLLRKWKTGDYFYPLGMPKKKKLARFFIDNKLSQLQKEAIWVLESNKRIVWVVGHRIDDRFKIVPSTKKVLKVRVTFTI